MYMQMVELAIAGPPPVAAMTVPNSLRSPVKVSVIQMVNDEEIIGRMIVRNMRAGYGQAVAISFMAVLVLIGTVLTNFFRKREVEL